MSHTPHELAEEFPQSIELMHRLKMEDAHFARLSEEYHEVNRAIHRAETLVEPVSDMHETELRRKRLNLKDDIARLLQANA
ncbi:MAG: YdcH family protein [Roseinatronobacter sp.]